MLVVETISKIRRAYFVEGKSLRQISRGLRLSRNTVRKVVRSGATEFTYTRSAQPAPRLIPGANSLMIFLRRMEAGEARAAYAGAYLRRASHSGL